VTSFSHRGWRITLTETRWTAVREAGGSLYLHGPMKPHLNPPYAEAIDEIDHIEIPWAFPPVDRSEPYEGVL
jgi:hypothetical protein